jgi:hypothetical protein
MSSDVIFLAETLLTSCCSGCRQVPDAGSNSGYHGIESSAAPDLYECGICEDAASLEITNAITSTGRFS